MAVLRAYPRLGVGLRCGRGLLGCLLWCGLLWAGTAQATTQIPTREYQIKAVFLLNFVQFAEWPADAFPDAASPLIIGVLGEDPFGPALDEAVRGEFIKGRSLTVRRYRRVEDVDQCHLLFISASEDARIDQILARCAGRSLLTVAEMEGFARRGGMIRFLTESKKIRFRINLTSVRAARLVLSSQLLRAAQIITEQEKSP